MNMTNQVGNFTPDDKHYYVSPNMYASLTGIRLKVVYDLVARHELRTVSAEGKVKIAVHERLFGCGCRHNFEIDWSQTLGPER